MDFDGIWGILKKMTVIIVLTAMVQWVMNTCNNKIAYQVVRDVRDEAFKKLQILPLKYIDGHSHGDIVSRVIADVDQFSDGLLMGFTQLFYRCGYNYRNLGFYVFHQCVNNDCRGDFDSAFLLYRGIYCKKDI